MKDGRVLGYGPGIGPGRSTRGGEFRVHAIFGSGRQIAISFDFDWRWFRWAQARIQTTPHLHLTYAYFVLALYTTHRTD